METVLDEGEVAKVHPVDEEMEGGGVWDGEEEDGVVRGAGHETGETVGRDGAGGGGWIGRVHEIEGEGGAEEAAEIGGMGGEIVHVELIGGEQREGERERGDGRAWRYGGRHSEGAGWSACLGRWTRRRWRSGWWAR